MTDVMVALDLPAWVASGPDRQRHFREAVHGLPVRFVQIRPLRSIPYSGMVVQVGIASGFRSVG